MVDAVVRRSVGVTLEGSIKGRGRPKSTLEAVVRQDLSLLDITKYDALDKAQWRKQIHVADHWETWLGLLRGTDFIFFQFYSIFKGLPGVCHMKRMQRINQFL